MAENDTGWIEQTISLDSQSDLNFKSEEARSKVIGKLKNSISMYGYPRAGVRIESHGSNIENQFFNDLMEQLPKLVIEGVLKVDLGLSINEIADISNRIATIDHLTTKDKRIMNSKSRVLEPILEFQDFEETNKLFVGDNLASFFPRIQDGVSKEVVENYIKDFNSKEQEIRKYIYKLVSEHVFFLERSEQYSDFVADNLDLRNKFHTIFANKIMPYVDAHLQVLRKQILSINYPENCTRDRALNLLESKISQIKFGITYIASHRMPAVESMALGQIRLNHQEARDMISSMPYNMSVGKFLRRVGDINRNGLNIDSPDLLGLSVHALLNRKIDYLDIAPVVMPQIISHFDHVKYEQTDQDTILKGLILSNLEDKLSLKQELKYFQHLLNLASLYWDCTEQVTGRFIWGSHIKIDKQNRRGDVDLNFQVEKEEKDILRNHRVMNALKNVVLIVCDPISGKSIERRIDLDQLSFYMTILRQQAELKLLGHNPNLK